MIIPDIIMVNYSVVGSNYLVSKESFYSFVFIYHSSPKEDSDNSSNDKETY